MRVPGTGDGIFSPRCLQPITLRVRFVLVISWYVDDLLLPNAAQVTIDSGLSNLSDRNNPYLAARMGSKSANVRVWPREQVIHDTLTFGEMKTPKKTIVDVEINNPDTKIKMPRQVAYVRNGCRYYFNAQHKLFQLTRGERAFYDFLCEHMDESNRVTVDLALRTAFGNFINRVTSTKSEFQPSSASKYLCVLMTVGLLLETSRTPCRSSLAALR